MNDRLKKAFGAVHAENALKEKTSEFLFQKIRGYEAKRRPLRRLLPVMACCFLVLLFSLGAGWAYFTPVSAITIDINPSIELSINRFDRVLSVKGYNEEGRSIADALHVTFLSYEDALHQIFSDADIQKHLERDEPMSIVVICADDQKSGQMLSTVQHCTQDHHNVHCHTGNGEEAAAAQEAGLSLGKYRAFLELQALDPTVTAEEIQGMSMREIRDRIASLSGGADNDISGVSGTQSSGTEGSQIQSSSACEETSSYEQGHEQEPEHGHGQGNGKHHGWNAS